MYPAKEDGVAGSACAGDASVAGCVCGCVCVCVSGVGVGVGVEVEVGGVATGTPVREWRRGGMMDVECEVGERTRRRRGLRMVLGEGAFPGGGAFVVISNCVVL